MHILVIEDDAKTASYLRKGLRESGHAVDWAGDGKDGLFMAMGCLFYRLGPVSLETMRGIGRRMPWTFLAFVPSALLLTVTTYVTTDIAPVPLLWLVPLGIYLGAFALAFLRSPSKVELAGGLALVRAHGLRALCRALFNSNEFLFLS